MFESVIKKIVLKENKGIIFAIRKASKNSRDEEIIKFIKSKFGDKFLV